MNSTTVQIAGRTLTDQLAKLSKVDGSLAVPILLDAGEPPSHVTWFRLLANDSFAIGKQVDFGSTCLLFSSTAPLRIQLANWMLAQLPSTCQTARVFFQPSSGNVEEVLCGQTDFKVEKTARLLVMSHTSRQLERVSQYAFRNLDVCDTEVASKLYECDGKNIFSPEHLAQGGYYGLFSAGGLVASCCIYGHAAIGNSYLLGGFVTSPNDRRRGYAYELCSRLCHDVLPSQANVTLHVESDNSPAICLYKKLGFRHDGELMEYDCTRVTGN